MKLFKKNAIDPKASVSLNHENIIALAYPEQIPSGANIYILGTEECAIWTYQLLYQRGYAPKGFIDMNRGSSIYGVPTVSIEELNLTCTDAIVLATGKPESIPRWAHTWFQGMRNQAQVYDASYLYLFTHCSCKNDKTDLLIQDLGVCYSRVSSEQLLTYGEVYRRIKRLPMDQYVRNIESRYGQGSRYVVNIGCFDGVSGDPCYPLYQSGWRGVAIDAIPEHHPVGQAALANLGPLNVKVLLGTFVTPMNIEALLKSVDCPYDCDCIKVDIDSYDGPLIRQILNLGYKPRVFCIEINACFPPPIAYALDYSEDVDSESVVHIGMYGCSAQWAADVFAQAGYTFARYEFGYPKLIGGIRDMIFVRNDVVQGSGVAGVDHITAYYAEPLGWSHLQAGLKIDPRQWHHLGNERDSLEIVKSSLFSKLQGLKEPLNFELYASTNQSPDMASLSEHSVGDCERLETFLPHGVTK